ncbi:MAG TPA: hypothetical protein VL179_16460 [Mycobacterium sp.]|nr:hypothetical protein [Mycobacterium sp.]
MTSPSSRFDGDRLIPALGGPISSGQARRLSRRFGAVGVGIPAARLQEIGTGATASDRESTDIRFALTAIALEHDERVARARDWRQTGVRWLIVAAVTVAALNFLVCLGYVSFTLLGRAGGF